MAGEHLPPVELPLQCSPREVAVPREETASSHLSIEAEIDQFSLKEEGKVPDRPVELSDFEADFDRSFTAHLPRLVVAWIDTSSEEEEEMALNPRKGFNDLAAGRKGHHPRMPQRPNFLPIFPFPLSLPL